MTELGKSRISDKVDIMNQEALSENEIALGSDQGATTPFWSSGEERVGAALPH